MVDIIVWELNERMSTLSSSLRDTCLPSHSPSATYEAFCCYRIANNLSSTLADQHPFISSLMEDLRLKLMLPADVTFHFVEDQRSGVYCLRLLASYHLIGLVSYDGESLRLFIFTLKQQYPISTLPEHLHSTSLSYAETTLNSRKLVSFPLIAHYLSAGPPLSPTPPFTGRPGHTHT